MNCFVKVKTIKQSSIHYGTTISIKRLGNNLALIDMFGKPQYFGVLIKT